MITQFNIHGAMVYLDEQGNHAGYEDVFTRSRCAASTTPRSGWGRITWTSSSVDPSGMNLLRWPTWRLPPAGPGGARPVRGGSQVLSPGAGSPGPVLHALIGRNP